MNPLKKIAHERNMLEKDFAKELGIHPQTLSNYIKDPSKVSEQLGKYLALVIQMDAIKREIERQTFVVDCMSIHYKKGIVSEMYANQKEYLTKLKQMLP